uniref:Uncharacterized protein n=1 Tax=Caenorhabditis tropicalis TaxID=1561998 RepID=A0A1I7U3M0_9PELO
MPGFQAFLDSIRKRFQSVHDAKCFLTACLSSFDCFLLFVLINPTCFRRVMIKKPFANTFLASTVSAP